MTALQVYGLVMPFVLLGLGWLAAWWSHRESERSRREIGAERAKPAE